MRQNSENVSPMSNQGRNAYVIEHITEALLKLLAEKPMSDISISELCQCAQIGRASFYRNFDRKEDILKLYVSQIFAEEVPVNDGGSLSQLIRSVFTHFEHHREFYDVIRQRGFVYLLKDTILEICGLSPDCSKTEAYSKAFAAYSLYGWIEVWFQRGMQESAEEMAGMFEAQRL